MLSKQDKIDIALIVWVLVVLAFLVVRHYVRI